MAATQDQSPKRQKLTHTLEADQVGPESPPDCDPQDIQAQIKQMRARIAALKERIQSKQQCIENLVQCVGYISDKLDIDDLSFNCHCHCCGEYKVDFGECEPELEECEKHKCQVCKFHVCEDCARIPKEEFAEHCQCTKDEANLCSFCAHYADRTVCAGCRLTPKSPSPSPPSSPI